MANYQPAAAKMQELAQDYGVAVVFMPAGPLVEYNPDEGQAAADDAGGAAGVVQGQSEPLDLRAARQLGTWTHVHHGIALHPGRQQSQGSGEGVGQDLGVPEGPQQLHRVLPDRHGRRDEGIGRGLARHHASR